MLGRLHSETIRITINRCYLPINGLQGHNRVIAHLQLDPSKQLLTKLSRFVQGLNGRSVSGCERNVYGMLLQRMMRCAACLIFKSLLGLCCGGVTNLPNGAEWRPK